MVHLPGASSRILPCPAAISNFSSMIPGSIICVSTLALPARTNASRKMSFVFIQAAQHRRYLILSGARPPRLWIVQWQPVHETARPLLRFFLGFQTGLQSLFLPALLLFSQGEHPWWKYVEPRN